MAGNREGAIKRAAAAAGISPEEFTGRHAAGLHRCSACKEWRARDQFGNDRTRWDGVDRRCLICRRVAVPKTTKGRPSPMRGKRFSEAARANMGKPKGWKNPTKGQKRSPEMRRKLSASLRASDKVKRGAEARTYIDGRHAERMDERLTPEYKKWRFDVFLRDGFTCQDCGDGRGGNLHAHHIKSFADFPALRLDLANGVTLCRACHRKRHKAA